MNPEWFAGRLRELREQAGLSRKQLAERAALESEAGIRNLEQGIVFPSWKMVLALCKALGVTCDAFTQQPSEDLPPPKSGRPRKSSSVEGAPDVQTPAPLSSESATVKKKPRRKK